MTRESVESLEWTSFFKALSNSFGVTRYDDSRDGDLVAALRSGIVDSKRAWKRKKGRDLDDVLKAETQNEGRNLVGKAMVVSDSSDDGSR